MHAGVADPERREAPELHAQVEIELRARHDRIDARHRPQVVLGEHRVGVRGERRREGLDALGRDRQTRRGAMAAEALEVRRARAEPAVQVERRDRAAGALPLAVGAGDQHDRPVVPLDEPRGDDADHALVPALAGDDVAAAAAARLRPRLDLVDRLAQDALLDRLPLAVQRLELLGEPLRLAIVLGEQQRRAQPRDGRAGRTR